MDIYSAVIQKSLLLVAKQKQTLSQANHIYLEAWSEFASQFERDKGTAQVIAAFIRFEKAKIVIGNYVIIHSYIFGLPQQMRSVPSKHQTV